MKKIGVPNVIRDPRVQINFSYPDQNGPLTKHDGMYPFELRDADQAVIEKEFNQMLGRLILDCGPLESEEELRAIQDVIMRGNNDLARRARKQGVPWMRKRLVVWRGCWAVFEIRQGYWRHHVSVPVRRSSPPLYDFAKFRGLAPAPDLPMYRLA